MPAPFLLFSWEKPFLPALKEHMITLCNGDMAKARIILPHNRPRRYLVDLFRCTTTPCLLPQIYTLEEIVSACSLHNLTQAEYTAGLPDRIALLHACVQNTAEHTEGSLSVFKNMTLEHFIPWGRRLADLFEECFIQNLTPPDIAYTDDEVAPLAASLLGSLGKIYAAYQESFEQRNWTTPSRELFRIARTTQRTLPPLLDPQQGNTVIIAGFSSLTAAEDILLRHFWEEGALCCLHTDTTAATTPQTKAHWACEEHHEWQKRWRAQSHVISQPSGHKTHLSFYEGFDLHSQLAKLSELLRTPPQNDRTRAVVLTQSSLLMPVLHHLPEKEVNISLGYPVARSPLTQLFESILNLQQHKTPDNMFRQKDVIRWLEHPYIRMLYPQINTNDGQDDQQTLHQGSLVFSEQEKSPTNLLIERFDPQAPFISLSTLRCEHKDAYTIFYQELTDTCLTRFASVSTLQDLTDALEGLITFLLTYGSSLWKRFPLDAEAIYRMTHHVLPQMRDSLLATEPLSQATLHRFLKEILEQERIPFEADPITGLQVLGMLETRLLQFDEVYLIDATDNALPGNPAQDPLLPDALRRLIGLPTGRRRELTVAHNLYRLLQSTHKAHIFWQESTQKSELFDNKSSRSRFIEQLLWEKEKTDRQRLKADHPDLHSITFPISPVSTQRRSLPVTSNLHESRERLFQSPLAATTLNTWLTCPFRFAMRYLCNIRPLKELQEGDDPARVGELLHTILHELYKSRIGKTILRHDISDAEIQETIIKQLALSPLQSTLPPANFLMLQEALPLRLKNFFAAQPEQTLLFSLEQKLETSFPEANCRLQGRIDRMDVREKQLHILDYKSGNIHPISADIWTDTLFWDTLEEALAGTASMNTPAEESIREHIPDIQLPLYLHLAQSTQKITAGNAAWVHLRDDGKEKCLLEGPLMPEETYIIISRRIPRLLTFILQRLRETNDFPARESRACTWCDYRSLCTV